MVPGLVKLKAQSVQCSVQRGAATSGGTSFSPWTEFISGIFYTLLSSVKHRIRNTRQNLVIVVVLNFLNFGIYTIIILYVLLKCLLCAGLCASQQRGDTKGVIW